MLSYHDVHSTLDIWFSGYRRSLEKGCFFCFASQKEKCRPWHRAAQHRITQNTVGVAALPLHSPCPEIPSRRVTSDLADTRDLFGLFHLSSSLTESAEDLGKCKTPADQAYSHASWSSVTDFTLWLWTDFVTSWWYDCAMINYVGSIKPILLVITNWLISGR